MITFGAPSIEATPDGGLWVVCVAWMGASAVFLQMCACRDVKCDSFAWRVVGENVAYARNRGSVEQIGG